MATPEKKETQTFKCRNFTYRKIQNQGKQNVALESSDSNLNIHTAV